MNVLLSRSATRSVIASAKKGTQKASDRKGGAGYRKFDGDALWLPNTTRPEWLDGSLPGDRGFDPLGLSKPGQFIAIGVDGNDQNLAQNLKGGVEEVYSASSDQLFEASAFAPYSEVFGIQRFRECELQHGRWAMLAALGAIVSELSTGVTWIDAGKVELDGASWAGLALPFSITQLIWIEVLAVGYAEFARNAELDPERRLYPGGPFDPLGLASGDKAANLKEAEIKHARLAMVAFLGFSVQALVTGEGVLGSLIKFVDNI